MTDTRIAVLALALFTGVCASACGDSRYLAVDLRTDYAAGVEYDAVEVSLDGRTPTRVAAGTDRSDRPRRVFEREDLAPGVHAIDVSLRLGEARVASRRVQVTLDGARIVTVVISRDCREVGCPTSGATECLGGRCVLPECTALGEPGCPEAECVTNAECVASVSCAAGLCVEGACLEVPLLDACGASMVCVPERGCVGLAPSDAGATPLDTGPVDGGPSGPYAPVAPATNSVWTVQDSASPPTAIGATDVDGDIVGYEVRAGGPLRGSVSFVGDSFVFTPSAGAVGSDAFTLRVSDSGGRFVDQVVSVTIVPLPSTRDWRYFAGEGEAVTLGGGGEVTGTNGVQDVSLADVPGIVRFDPSFNRGNDIVRLSGPAADWRVSHVSSNATLTDGATFAQIPAGAPGIALVFDDGIRRLRIGGSGSTLEVGSQTVTDVYLPITAPAEIFTLPTGIDPVARGRLLLSEGGTVVVGGRTDLYGTNGLESVVLLGGDIQFDGSFNRGGDSIAFPGNAATYRASTSGSQVLVATDALAAHIPFGATGMSLVFTDATHSLRYDGTDARIGAQRVTSTPAFLTGA